MARELSDLQLRFCQEYAKDLNATKAYIRAGYRAKTENSAASGAAVLLRNPKIQAYLGEILNLSEVSVVSQVIAIAFGEITDVIEYDGSNLSIKPTAQWSDRIKKSVKSISVTRTEGRNGITTTATVTMHDKLNALDKLMRRLRLYPKEMSAIDAVQYLVSQGLMTEKHAEVILNGVNEIEEGLRSLASGEDIE